MKRPIVFQNRAFIFRFLLAVFICRCASARLSKRIGSAVDAHQQRGRCASANNFSAYKQKKRCAKSMNQTYLNASATGIAWQTVADIDNSTIINRADIDAHVKLYAISATKINDIRILPPIGGHRQVEKEEHYIYTKSIFYAPKKSVAAKLVL